MKWIGRLALLGFSLLFAVGLCEIALRVVAPQPASWLAIYRRQPDGLPFYSFLPGLDYRVETGETRWTVHTDAAGHRTALSPPAVAAAAPIVYGIGDSFMAGYSVDYADSFAGHLAAALAPRARFVNLGAGGYGPAQYRALVEHTLETQPTPAAIVVSVFPGNDFHDSQWDKDLPVADGLIGARDDLKSLIKRNSHFYRLVSKAVHVLQAAQGTRNPAPFPELYRPEAWREPFLEKGLATTRAELAAIARACDERAVPLVVLLVPPAETIGALDGSLQAEAGEDYALPVAKMSKILAELGVEIVDPTPGLVRATRDASYFPIDRHFTERGYGIVGDQLASAVEARLFSSAR